VFVFFLVSWDRTLSLCIVSSFYLFIYDTCSQSYLFASMGEDFGNSTFSAEHAPSANMLPLIYSVIRARNSLISPIGSMV